MVRAQLSLALVVLAAGCWRPPELPPDEGPEPVPSEAELLAQRPYSARVPDGYSDASEWPLMIILHGYGGSGYATAQYLGLPTAWKATGFVVSPNGVLDRAQNRAWHPDVIHRAPWDVEYLMAIVHDLEAKYRIDRSRVFFVGHSQGAHMAHRMGCDAASEVAAIVSLAGQVTTKPGGCVPVAPVSVFDLHGTFDNAIGYEGDLQNDPPDPDIPSAHQTLGVWGAADGCGALAARPERYDLDGLVAGAETSVEAYEGCPAGIDVTLWSLAESGHNPALTPTFVEQVSAFLLSHPKVPR